jgi:tripartite-type tricarboxylate transporter receptor subunit TctC
MLRRKILLIALASLLAPALADAVQAQAWPQRPVTMIVPFAPGGNTDGIARTTAQWLNEKLGQQFVVENRAGAGGAIAAEMVARAPADGYTLLVAALPQIAIVPAISPVRYDPVKDFAPISAIGINPFVLAVHKDVPVKTLAEFVAYVRAQPQKLSYASAGIGSLNHLSMALFLKLAGIDMVHVPYKG